MSSPRASDVRVSVILPVYGTAPFVADALDSVVGQTFGDNEIIVVNDGSPTARYVAMLDSDDRWHPEYLASQLRFS